MKMFLLACALVSLQGCALYRFDVSLPDGVGVKGWAFIANDSKQVEIDISKSATGEYQASFGKHDTNSDAQTKALMETINDLTKVPFRPLI